MSQNPAANIDDLPEVADASIWNLAIVLQHKEASSFEASGPPGTLLHDSWGEGFASDLGASLPHVEAFFPVQVSQTIQRPVVVGDLLLP